MPLVRAPCLCGDFSDLAVMQVGLYAQAQVIMSRHRELLARLQYFLFETYEDTINEKVLSYFRNYLADFQ